MWYKEDKKGQVLQEGINEAGAVSDWIAAATSYATHNITMIPFKGACFIRDDWHDFRSKLLVTH
jgi:pyruvate dehydrogenase complex dehydrogenase (E1) component